MDSRLRVQRLCEPLKDNKKFWALSLLKEAQASDLRGPYLAETLVSDINDIFSFDNMGANFPYVLPLRTIRGMLLDGYKLVRFTHTIPGKIISPGFWRETAFRSKLNSLRKESKKRGESYSGPKKLSCDLPDRVVYVICRREDRNEVKSIIEKWASGKENTYHHVGFCALLDPNPNYKPIDYHTPFGWLEVDRGFFIFIDESMWKRLGRLLGVPRVKYVMRKIKRRKKSGKARSRKAGG